MKTKCKDLENKLDNNQKDFIKSVKDIAEQIRQEIIIPFCNKKKVSFLSLIGEETFEFLKNPNDLKSAVKIPECMTDLLCAYYNNDTEIFYEIQNYLVGYEEVDPYENMTKKETYGGTMTNEDGKKILVYFVENIPQLKYKKL